MKKDEFIKKLNKRLSILNDEERKNIIEEYENYINQKIKSGISEVDAVKDFGDFDTLVEEILKAYKINSNYDKSAANKLENIFDIIVDEMVKFLKKLIRLIGNKSGEDLLRILCKIILLLILIWLMHIPFLFIKYCGLLIFKAFPGVFETIFSILWNFLIEIIYFILSIVMIYKLIKKMIFEEEVHNDNNNYVSKETTHTVLEEVDNKINTKSILGIFLTILKIVVVFTSLPFVFSLIGLLISMGIFLALCFKGIYFISIFLILIGCILVNYSFLRIVYSLVFKGDNK